MIGFLPLPIRKFIGRALCPAIFIHHLWWGVQRAWKETADYLAEIEAMQD